jgi:sugar lactone lactonase YvrE
MKTTLRILCSGFFLLIATATQAQIINTIAGSTTSGYSGDGGAATSATLNHPKGSAVDALGNVYIADADNNRIRKINTSGIISTVAGSATGSYTGDGGPAIFATLNRPSDVKVDAAGNIFICDANNHCIRKINTSGTISTVAGTGGVSGFSGDGGPAISAEMDFPCAIALDAAGNLYIADQINNRIRKVNTTGTISTIIGTGATGYSGDGASGTTTAIGFPFGVAVDGAGNVYVSLYYDNRVIKMNTSGVVSTYAGTGLPGFSGDGGAAAAAELDGQWGITTDAAGNLYIADFNNQKIRKVNTSGTISTIAGTSSGFSGDGGLATAAQLRDPAGVATGPGGSVYIADYGNHRIRKINGAATATSNPTFTGGHNQTWNVCQDAAATPINTLLAVADADLGQTETWSTVLAPLHGTLVAAYTTTSTGFTLTPAGLTYMPTAGYNGLDSFKVRVNDGTASDTTTVVVTVNPLPTAGTITGTDSVCPGFTVTLSNATTGGTWSSSSSSIATVSAAGVVTGVAPGTATITYTVSNSCGTATGIKAFKVRAASVCPTGIAEVTTVNKFEVYPNPSNGQFVAQVISGADEEVNIVVTNVLGEKIREIKTTTGKQTIISAEMPAGIYFFYATTPHGQWKEQVVVTQ